LFVMIYFPASTKTLTHMGQYFSVIHDDVYLTIGDFIQTRLLSYICKGSMDLFWGAFMALDGREGKFDRATNIPRQVRALKLIGDPYKLVHILNILSENSPCVGWLYLTVTPPTAAALLDANSLPNVFPKFKFAKIAVDSQYVAQTKHVYDFL
jgi:hypothetical protein